MEANNVTSTETSALEGDRADKLHRANPPPPTKVRTSTMTSSVHTPSRPKASRHTMNSRRKSCEACHRAKRRCNLQNPCGRCIQRALSCNYAAQPRNSPSDRTFPSSEYASMVIPVLGSFENQTQDVLLMSSEASAMHIRDFDTSQYQPPSIDDWTLEQRFESSIPLTLSDFDEIRPKNSDLETFRYLAAEILKSYPLSFVRLGHLPFIHRQSYKQTVSKATRITFQLCAAYIAKTSMNEHMVYSIVDCTAFELSQTHPQTLEEGVALVQGLLILQIIRLFDGDVRQRVLGEQGEKHLEQCTLQLHAKLIRQEEEFAGTWSGWLLLETVRRTVIMSYLLRGIYSMLKSLRCPSLKTLSQLKISVAITCQGRDQPTIDWDSSRQQVNAALMTYEDYVNQWEMGLVTEVDPLGRLLLVACQGQQKVEERSPMRV